MTETKPTWPAPPSTYARERGALGKRALADLEAMAQELKDAGSVEKAAERCGVLVVNYERRFRELAKVAKWKSWNPDDYLADRPSTEGRGGRRHAGPPLTETVAFGGRCRPETKALVVRARAVLDQRDGSGSLDEFLAGAANYILSGKHFDC